MNDGASNIRMGLGLGGGGGVGARTNVLMVFAPSARVTGSETRLGSCVRRGLVFRAELIDIHKCTKV